MNNLPSSRRVYYPGLSGFQQSERPRIGREARCGCFNAESYSYESRSLSDIDRSTTANDPHPPASFSARKKASMYSSDYTSGFFRPAALHPAVPLSPRHEGNVGRAPRRISPEMARRLSKALGRSPESWLAMPYNHDLWQAKQHVKLGKVGKVRLTAA